jgi:hypothetical protein
MTLDDKKTTFDTIPITQRLVALCHFMGLTHREHLCPTHFYVPDLMNLLLAELDRRIQTGKIDLLDIDDKAFDFRCKRYGQEIKDAEARLKKNQAAVAAVELVRKKAAIVAAASK